jgi:uncharacterized cupin superfamily protein
MSEPAMDDRDLPATGTFALDPRMLALEAAPLDPSQVLEGSPLVSERVVWVSEDGRQARGVWQITPGIVTDVEVDEVFVVVSGRATIEVEDGPTVDVGPGDLCVLEAGARTTWRVHETFRKVFHVSVPADEE